jgi:PKD repeat protein
LFQGTSERVVGGGPGGAGSTGRNIFVDEISWTAFPPICTGTPNVGSIVKSTNIICGGSGSAILSLTAPITNAGGLTYDWQSSTTATGPFTTIVGSGNTITANTGTLSSPTTKMYYQCVVTCSGSTLSYTTPLDSITISNAVLPTVMVSPTSVTLCSGTIATFTASNVLTYTWSSTNAGLNATTGSTVTATPPAGGFGGGGGPRIIIVTGFDAAGCSDTAHVVLTVNNSPNATITSSILNDSICVGTSVILSMPNAGGGGGGGVSWSWSNGVTTRVNTVSPTATTTYIGTATSNANQCTASDTVTIVVNVGTPPTVAVSPITATYCVGGAGVTLVASGTATTYTWSPSATLNTSTGTTVIATPTGGGGGGANTIYTVTGSNGLCSTSATVTVTRSNPPTATITTNLVNDTMCTGGTVILTGPNGGFGGALTYNWSNGVITQNDSSMIATVGTYPFTLIVSNAAGCADTATRNIEVISGTQPNLVVTPSSPIRFCTLTSTSATVTIKGATTYSWNNVTGVTFLSTSNDSASVTPGMFGASNYTITGSIGACSSKIQISVTGVNPPTTGVIRNVINPGVDTVCPGTIVVLRAPGGGGGGATLSYLWDDTKTTRNDTITVNATSWIHVTVSSAPGCSVVDSIQMVLASGGASFGYTTDTSSVYFADLSANATSWTWDFGDTTALAFTQNPVHNYTNYGTHMVILTITDACGSYSDTMAVNFWPAGINDLKASQIYAYPNPVTNDVNLSFQLKATSAELTIVNTLGQVMESKTIQAKSANEFNEKLSLAKYPNGVYTVKVKSDNNLLNVRLIKSN